MIIIRIGIFLIMRAKIKIKIIDNILLSKQTKGYFYILRKQIKKKKKNKNIFSVMTCALHVFELKSKSPWIKDMTQNVSLEMYLLCLPNRSDEQHAICSIAPLSINFVLG